MGEILETIVRKSKRENNNTDIRVVPKDWKKELRTWRRETVGIHLPLAVNLKPGDTVELYDTEIRGSRGGPYIESYTQVVLYRGHGKRRQELLRMESDDISLLYTVRNRAEELAKQMVRQGEKKDQPA